MSRQTAEIVAIRDDPGLFEEILDAGSDLRLQVTGVSMAPLIRAGDRVTIRKLPVDALTPGDIIFLINNSGKPVVHRILKKRCRRDKIEFHTKGDALLEYDQWIESGNVLGKICLIEKLRGESTGAVLNLETNRWHLEGRLMAIFQIIRSKILLRLRDL